MYTFTPVIKACSLNAIIVVTVTIETYLYYFSENIFFSVFTVNIVDMK